MKKGTFYEYHIKFPAISESNIQVGEALEALGRNKTKFIVDAIYQYLLQNAGVYQQAHTNQSANIFVPATGSQQISPQDLKLSNTLPSAFSFDTPSGQNEDDIAQMLDNLKLFQ